MKPLLFRFKIASLSVLMSGVLVVGVGVFFLVVIGRVGMARIDDEIRGLGEAQLRGQHPLEHWANFDRSLAFIYGDKRADRIAVQVRDSSGDNFFTSSHWPEELSRITVPALEFELPPSVDRAHPAAFPGDDGPPRPGGPGHRPGFMGPPPHLRDHGHERRPPPARLMIPVFETHTTSTGEWRVGFMGNQFITLIVAADLAEWRRETAFFRKAFFIITPLALLALAAGGWLLATRALRPVAIITRTVESITARGLATRVPVTTADVELARLVDVINRMLDRLERSFHQAARFSADAAHELQTPLTVLQGELDNAVQEAVAGSGEQQRYSGLLEEVRSLKAVVQKLLLLARADVGQLPLSLEDVDLSALLESAVEDVQVMAPQLTVEAHIPGGIQVTADVDLLGQVIRNMTTNAVKYNLAGGAVRFNLESRVDVVSFTLANTGTAIPEEDRERIFDRS